MLLIYTHTITPRLQYIVEFIGRELFDEAIQITTDEAYYKASTLPRLNYSVQEFSDEEFFIRNTPLLFETGVRPQTIECFEINFHKAFFETRGDFPFDILAASFYLISRYEEYLPHEKDAYGRYAHTNSLAYREHFLSQPLINYWLQSFRKALQFKFPDLVFKQAQFKCVLTYDIDIAWSYLHKGWKRTLGGFVNSISKGEWARVKDRWLVLRGKRKDPFDCFEWLDAWHLYCRLKPHFFFLAAKRTSRYDKNNSYQKKAFRDLVAYYANAAHLGWHPSWQSGDDPALLKEELEWLEVVSDIKIAQSRQHYIRFSLPVTYRRLIQTGIEKDFSMGYGSINGFRASVCSPFYWYDLEKEAATSLMLYPFCFMDANSLFEQKQTPQQTYNELIQYYERVKGCKGVFIPIWHNFILGTDPLYEGWRSMFELFMKETVYWDAYNDEV
ncbi:hypothetical protein FAM09_19735 [Niastella caeni]|uniref:DUF7033 domain-containing protein n=1 Tax=Niastella caeni TaxID=2569763 RepID=A0A4S8HT76_9BACT|nr:hypothetical protein [Niastella caeni]THU37184.1 hypothetical protein FAM09_19735 [Niastella caeni]